MIRKPTKKLRWREGAGLTVYRALEGGPIVEPYSTLNRDPIIEPYRTTKKKYPILEPYSTPLNGILLPNPLLHP